MSLCKSLAPIHHPSHHDTGKFSLHTACITVARQGLDGLQGFSRLTIAPLAHAVARAARITAQPRSFVYARCHARFRPSRFCQAQRCTQHGARSIRVRSHHMARPRCRACRYHHSTARMARPIRFSNTRASYDRVRRVQRTHRNVHQVTCITTAPRCLGRSQRRANPHPRCHPR